MIIETLPNVLCVVLKRFCWTAKTRAKIDTHVQFPLEELDMAPYTADKSSPCVYDLKSAVIHHGSGYVVVVVVVMNYVRLFLVFVCMTWCFFFLSLITILPLG